MTLIEFTHIWLNRSSAFALSLAMLLGSVSLASAQDSENQKIYSSHNTSSVKKPSFDNKPTLVTGPEFHSKAAILDNLYLRLKQSQNMQTAQPIAEAIEELWLKSGSDTIDLLMVRAQAAVEKKEAVLALEILDAVVSMKPDYTEGWNRRAMIYFLDEDYERALLDLRRVLAIDPKNYRAINGLAMILQDTGNKAGALKVYKQLLEIHPHLVSAKQACSELTREIEGQDS